MTKASERIQLSLVYSSMILGLLTVGMALQALSTLQ